MATKSRKRYPILGEAFDSHFMNDAGRLNSYAGELEHYRPRGFSKLAREMRALADRFDAGKAREDDAERMDSMIDECEAMLTAWAQRVERHDYIHFGPFEHCGAVGFSVDAETAIGDADLTIDHGQRGASDEIPRGFSGLLVTITDHGNVSAFTYSRGRKCRELFAVV